MIETKLPPLPHSKSGFYPGCGCADCLAARGRWEAWSAAERLARRRRLRRRIWDVIAVGLVAGMLWGSGYLIGHAHSRVIHRVEILYAV